MSSGKKVAHPPIDKPGKRLLHHIELGFVQKKVSGGGHRGVAAALNLTSMIDYLVTVVIFLLMSFSTSGETPVDKNVTLPKAENTLDMAVAPIVAINGQQILVNSQAIGSTRAVDEAAGKIARIDELFNTLKNLREEALKINPDKKNAPKVVLLQIDKDVSAAVVKSVFQTCAAAGYSDISFMVGNLPKKG